LQSLLGGAVVTLSVGSMVATTGLLFLCCPRSETFGGSRLATGGNSRESNDCHQAVDEDEYFRTPFVPVWPLLGLFVNWYLIAQLSWGGVASMMSCLLLASVYYVVVARRHGADWGIHNSNNNRHHSYHQPSSENEDGEHDGTGPIEMARIRNHSHNALKSDGNSDGDARSDNDYENSSSNLRPIPPLT